MTGGSASPTLPAPFRLVEHEVLPSTNDEAKALAVAGAASGTLVVAARQTAGRGRAGRSWASPPGNLYLSLVLRPAVTPARAAELGLLAAVAVADTLAAWLPDTVPIALKWPNDVLAGGGKIAGILLEASASPSGPVDWVVLGIGLNLAARPAVAGYPTACLYDLATTRPTRDTVLGQLATALDLLLTIWRRDGFAPVRARWLALAQGLGQPLELRQGAAVVTGRFHDLDQDGALLLETAAGLRGVTAGDVHFPAA